MKKASSEVAFNLEPRDCPYRKCPCIKDDCTHFRRYHTKYECLRYKEEWEGAECHAGDHLELWCQYTKTDKPQTPMTWKDWLLVTVGIVATVIVPFLIIHWLTNP